MWTTSYICARATPELVGRTHILDEIQQIINDQTKSYVVYITGVGGIGKTRLVKDVLEYSPERLPLAVASAPVDLYHTSTSTVEGLIDCIQDVLSPEDDPVFEQYRKKRDQLQEDIILGKDISRPRQEEVREAFWDDFDALSRRRRIVLALDTAEKLFFRRDLAAGRLGLEEAYIAVRDWLIVDFLPRIDNIVVLLAGRPESNGLEEALADLEQSSDKQFRYIKLPGLDEEEALDYFDAVIRSAKASGDPEEADAVEAIENLSKERRRVIFHCLRDEGDPPTVRPILLAMAIDYMANVARLLPGLGRSLSEAQGLSPDERERIRNALTKSLAEMFFDCERRADELILALTWLRKGADAELLARIMRVDQLSVESLLEDLKHLSFVKIRPDDERFFLHDEMYSLLQQSAWRAEHEQMRVLETTRAYYKDRIARKRSEIVKHWPEWVKTDLPDGAHALQRETPATRGDSEESPTDPHAMALLREALVEDLHYSLLQGATEGFQTYFRYAEEAIVNNDTTLDIQLRAELLTFLAERDPGGQAEEIDGLRRADVVADAAVRWIKRFWSDGNYDQALNVVDRLRADAKDIIEAGDILSQIELDVWEAYVLTCAGKEAEWARELFDRAEKQIRSSSVQEAYGRRAAIWGRAYHNIGYHRRVLGQFVLAADSYKRALERWRIAEIESEYVNTLNDYALALVLRGHHRTAGVRISEAHEKCKDLGLLRPVALTYCIRAKVENYVGDHSAAEEYAERALVISRAITFPRGEGLAQLELAVAHRLQSEGLGLDGKKERLLQAVDNSDEARGTFSEKVKEIESKARAYRERGVAYRELSRLSESEDERKQYVQAAERALEEVRLLAREREELNEVLKVVFMEASFDLAWTYYYAKDTAKLESFLADLQEDIKQHFSRHQIRDDQIPERRADTIEGIFVPLAQWNVLRGMQLMDDFEQSSGQSADSALRAAAREFTIALQYNALINPITSLPDFERAFSAIHDRVRELDAPQLASFSDAVRETAARLGLAEDDCLFWRKLQVA